MARARSGPPSSSHSWQRSSELLVDEPTLSAVRIREEIEKPAMQGSKTILDDYLRELRPASAADAQPSSARAIAPESSRSSTSASRGERSRSAMARPAAAISSPASSAIRAPLAGALVFSKQFEDIAFGMSRCLSLLGALPDEARLGPRGRDHAGHGQPSEEFARLLRRAVARLGDPRGTRLQSQGSARSAPTASCTATSRPARRFANPLDFQDQLDRWCRARQRALAPLASARGPRRAPRRRAPAHASAARPMPDTELPLRDCASRPALLAL